MGLRERVVRGAKTGAGMGLAFAALATIVLLLGGRSAFEAQHSSYGKVVATYFLGGLSAGITVGLLHPLTRHKAGAAFVGFVAAIPVSVLIRFATQGSDEWRRTDLILILFMCTALGAPLGVAYRDIFEGGDRPK